MSILIVGATFVDMKGYSKYEYIPKGRNKGNIEIVHGGVVRNVCENIARSNMDTTLLTLVNDDGTGEDVVNHLKELNVNTDYIGRCENGMGTWLAVFNELGDVEASISARPVLLPLVKIIEDNESLFETCDAIVLEMDIDMEVVSLVFKMATKYNKDVYGVISNMSIAATRKPYIQKTKFFVCNQQEAGILYDSSFDNISNEAMISIIKDQLISENMIITLGDKGAVYVNANESGHVPALKVNVVDTTGAGDGFFSGVVLASVQGKTIEKACFKGRQLSSEIIQSRNNVISGDF